LTFVVAGGEVVARVSRGEVSPAARAVAPGLVVAALIFAGLAGVAEEAWLPEPVDVDPALLDEAERARRGVRQLPTSLALSTDAFEADSVLTADFGPERTAAIVAVRRGEIAHFGGATPEEITDQLRWVH